MSELTFGLLGAGHFGRNYIRILQSIPGVKLLAVADISQEALSGLEVPLSTIKTLNFQEVIDNQQIDCVIIATPTFSHFTLSQAVLRAGKHVLVEKPMVSKLEEAKSLRDDVLKSGNILMVGHQYLYNDYIRRLKKRIEAGDLGQVRTFSAEHFYCRPGNASSNCFWETATHELAIIDYLFSPRKIYDVKGRLINISGDGRYDFTTVNITYGNDLYATLINSWCMPEKIRRFVVAGDQGTALYNDYIETGKLKFFSYAGQSQPDKAITVDEMFAREPLLNEIEHFIECIRFNRSPLTNIEHGLRITEQLAVIFQRLAIANHV